MALEAFITVQRRATAFTIKAVQATLNEIIVDGVTAAGVPVKVNAFDIEFTPPVAETDGVPLRTLMRRVWGDYWFKASWLEDTPKTAFDADLFEQLLTHYWDCALEDVKAEAERAAFLRTADPVAKRIHEIGRELYSLNYRSRYPHDEARRLNAERDALIASQPEGVPA